MPTVTICIPAFRAEGFVADTVRSALAQTFNDIAVEVAIEPPGLGELSACEPLLGDPRLRVTVNASVLGWAENIAAMLRRVRTPYFVVLPHDDFLHSRYIEVLLAALQSRPDAVVAYGDIQIMTGGAPQRRRLLLDEGALTERLLSFLAAGAEALPWRGVTRSAVLKSESFPTDGYQGLLVESEWAYHLLTRGVALRVPQTLYFKRLFSGSRTTASTARVRTDAKTIWNGIEDHRRRLIARTEAALMGEAVPSLLMHGIEAVVARRRLRWGLTEFDTEAQERFANALSACRHDHTPYGRRILANLLLVQSSLALNTGDQAAALEYARDAISKDESNAGAHMQVARLLQAAGRLFEALQAAARACDISPYTPGSGDVFAQLEKDFLDSLST